MAEFSTSKRTANIRYGYDNSDLTKANFVGKIDIENKRKVSTAGDYNKAVSFSGKKNVALKSLNCNPKSKSVTIDGEKVFYFEH